MNKIKQLIEENKVTQPVINSYTKCGHNVQMKPATDAERSVDLDYDSYNLVDGYRYILFNSRTKLCYIFKPVDFELIGKNLEHKIKTGQTKV